MELLMILTYTAIRYARGTGQLQPTGALIDPRAGRSPVARSRRSRSPMISPPINSRRAPRLRSPSYTEHWHHFLLRMKSWMNYVFTEGH